MASPVPQSFGELEACYGQIMSWCDLLEAIADSLPSHVDDRPIETITAGLVPLLQTTCELEERVVCSQLGLIMTERERVRAVEQRRAGRVLDMGAAQEVVSVLDEVQEGVCALSWDAVGYLLRSFFSSMRKHVQAQREIIAQIRRTL